MIDTVILGGGQTGRGFIGRLLFESGIPFVIIDKNRALIDALNRKSSYTIRFFSAKSSVIVNGFEAFHTSSVNASEAIQNAKNIFISVGAENLETAARYLFENRACPQNIILCENAINPSMILRENFKNASNYPKINFVETAIFCTTMNMQNDSVDICSEEYHKLPYDKKSATGCLFKTPFFEPEAHFEILLKRKIYTYNAASAIIAYNGWHLGYSAYADAANDPEIQKALNDFYSAINHAICAEYSIAPYVQREFSKMSLSKFANPNINDSIERNARQPLRKLGPDERISFPMKLLLKYGLDIQPLCKTAALAVLYGEKNEPDWVKRYGTGQAGIVFSFISGITDKTVIDSINFSYINLI